MIHKMMQYLLLMLMSAMLSLTQASETPNNKCNPFPPLKVLLDTDPGGDDALAMLWLQSLAKQCLVEIVAVTAEVGNVSGKHTFTNASKILTLGGFDQVEMGRAVPPKHSCPDASYIHGEDGMGGLSKNLPCPVHDINTAPSAEDLIIEKLNAAPNEIIVIAIGPLTNLAAAEEKSPGILAKAKEVVIMGATFHYHGNVTSHAEFNVYCNPPATQKVFASRDDIVVLPLDVTHKIIFTQTQADAVVAVNPESDIAQFIKELSEFMTSTALSYRETKGVSGFLVHDAATMAYMFYPETLLFRRAEVKVETKGEFSNGETLIDVRHSAKTKTNAWVGLEVDEVNVLTILSEDLKMLVKKPK